MTLEETKEKLKEIEVVEENQKEEKENILNPELIQLKEKLLSKKRKKIDKFYGGNKNEMEKTLENRLEEESDEGEEMNIISKINKIENKKNRNKIIKPKITQNNQSGDRRILANSGKLTSTKFK